MHYRLIGTRSSSFWVLVIRDMLSVPAEMSAVSCVRLVPVEHGCDSSASAKSEVSSPTLEHPSLERMVKRRPLGMLRLRWSSAFPSLPSDMRRGNGPLKYDDDYFIESARQDVEHLASLGLVPGSRFLDFGCGPGRLAVGLIASGWSGSYSGVEVSQRQVHWATESITSRFPDYRFVHVDAANDRYNPDGSQIPGLPSRR